jgi:hypothetical protein
MSSLFSFLTSNNVDEIESDSYYFLSLLYSIDIVYADDYEISSYNDEISNYDS